MAKFSMRNRTVEPVKTKLKVGDTVVKIAGKDKNKSGEILALDRTKGTVTVKGINVRNVFQRRTQENPQGGSIEKEFPFHISNAMLLDAKTKKGTRVKIQAITEKGKTRKARIGVKSGKEI